MAKLVPVAEQQRRRVRLWLRQPPGGHAVVVAAVAAVVGGTILNILLELAAMQHGLLHFNTRVHRQRLRQRPECTAHHQGQTLQNARRCRWRRW